MRQANTLPVGKVSSKEGLEYRWHVAKVAMLLAEVHHRLCGNQSGHCDELEAGSKRAHCSTPATAAVYNQELCHAAHQSDSPQHGLLGAE